MILVPRISAISDDRVSARDWKSAAAQRAAGWAWVTSGFKVLLGTRAAIATRLPDRSAQWRTATAAAGIAGSGTAGAGSVPFPERARGVDSGRHPSPTPVGSGRAEPDAALAERRGNWRTSRRIAKMARAVRIF